MPIKDLTGQRFGRLTVIEKTNKRMYGQVVWKCQCDCGNICEVPSANLKKELVKSCGCLRSKDLTGQKFGRLTVIEITKNRNVNGNIMWKCRCDCGNICEVSGRNLTRGITRSCGCFAREVSSNDLIGKRFGRLVVENITTKRRIDGSIVWKCRCDCGNICEVATNLLIQNCSKSCGCLRRGVSYSNMREHIDEVCVENTNLDVLNTKPTKANKSGRKGVYWDNRMQKWTATIGFQHKAHYLGSYDKFEDAVKARERAEEEYWQPILEEHGRELK